MSKWSKVKIAVLAATSMVATLQLGGCLGGLLNWDHIIKLATIGNLFD
jgi:hypothetical protein